jgi:hypothetical protein
MTLAASSLVVLASVTLGVASASPARPSAVRQSADAVCVSALVHYERSTDAAMPATPWVSPGRRGRQIVGYRFYYGPELRSTERLTIYVGGELPGGGSTKILWVPRQPGSSLLTITGERLDRPGRFVQVERPARAGGRTVFPSIVNVPEAGCWRLTLRNGRGRTARLAIVAIDRPTG